MRTHFPPIDKSYKFLQVNRGNQLGSLWATFGVDLQSNPGVVRASNKLVVNTSSADDADLGLPAAFERFNDRWFAVCGTRVFKTASADHTGAFTEDASSGAVTDYLDTLSDLKVFDGKLFASTEDELLSKTTATGAWTSVSALTAGTLHKLMYLRKTDRLYVTDDAAILSVDTAGTVVSSAGDYYLAISDTSLRMIAADVSSDSVWIGLTAADGTRGSVYRWDGISSQITREYKIEGAGVVALKVVGDIPYIIDTYGRIQRFNADSFSEVSRFPLDGATFTSASTTSSVVNKFIHHNGISETEDGTLLIGLCSVVDSSNSTSLVERLPSGVWELDLSNGNLTHRHGFSLKTFAATSQTDYAQPEISRIGALCVVPFSNSSTSGRPSLLAGARVYTDATSVRTAVFMYTDIVTNEKVKAAQLVGTWFNSQEAVESWQRLWVLYRRFLNSSDRIVAKHRTSEEAPVYATITWTSETTFTTTTDVSAYAQSASGFDGTYGGEVEVLRGTGGGACRHITGVSENAGTYTVTLDGAVTGATGTAKARFQKWVKLLPEVTGQVIEYADMPIGATAPRMQLKLYAEFTGDDEIHRAVVNSEPHIPTKS